MLFDLHSLATNETGAIVLAAIAPVDFLSLSNIA
jgi:hypothetical protein